MRIAHRTVPPRPFAGIPVVVSLLAATVCFASGCGRRATPPVSDLIPPRRTTQAGDVIGGEDATARTPGSASRTRSRRWGRCAGARPSRQAWPDAIETVKHGAACTQFASRFGGVTELKPGNAPARKIA